MHRSSVAIRVARVDSVALATLCGHLCVSRGGSREQGAVWRSEVAKSDAHVAARAGGLESGRSQRQYEDRISILVNAAH